MERLWYHVKFELDLTHSRNLSKRKIAYNSYNNSYNRHIIHF